MRKQMTLARVSACLATFAAALAYMGSPLAIVVSLATLSAVAAAIAIIRRNSSEARYRWLAFPIATAVLLSSHYASEALSVKESRAVLQASATASVTARELLEQRLDSDATALERLAGRMQTGLETNRKLWETDALNHTVSIGGALAFPGDAIETCLSFADSALYEAKQNGRNRVVMHSNVLRAA